MCRCRAGVAVSRSRAAPSTRSRATRTGTRRRCFGRPCRTRSAAVVVAVDNEPEPIQVVGRSDLVAAPPCGRRVVEAPAAVARLRARDSGPDGAREAERQCGEAHRSCDSALDAHRALRVEIDVELHFRAAQDVRPSQGIARPHRALGGGTNRISGSDSSLVETDKNCDRQPRAGVWGTREPFTVDELGSAPDQGPPSRPGRAGLALGAVQEPAAAEEVVDGLEPARLRRSLNDRGVRRLRTPDPSGIHDGALKARIRSHWHRVTESLDHRRQRLGELAAIDGGTSSPSSKRSKTCMGLPLRSVKRSRSSPRRAANALRHGASARWPRRPNR